MDVEYHLNSLIPHRLDALAILDLLLAYQLHWGEPKPMQVFVDGQLQFEGNTNLLTNPVFEAGVLHARALLQFLGLRAKDGLLTNIRPKDRQPDDVGIEKIPMGNQFLQVVTPEQVRKIEPENSDGALVALLEAANKGMAHFTTNYPANPAEANTVALAARLTQRLVEQYVYAQLGRTRSPPPIEARARRQLLHQAADNSVTTLSAAHVER